MMLRLHLHSEFRMCHAAGVSSMGMGLTPYQQKQLQWLTVRGGNMCLPEA